MRRRVKMTGLLYHSTPNGILHRSEEAELKVKFDKGTITKDELHKLAGFMAVAKRDKNGHKKYTEVKIFGKWEPIEKYDIDILIAQNFQLR